MMGVMGRLLSSLVRMRRLFLFCLLSIVLACCIYQQRRHAPSSTNTMIDTVTVTKTDTIYIRDTVTRFFPKPYEVHIVDTIYVKDTILFREQKIYNDSMYSAWVSGYNPSLDSIRVFPRTIVIHENVTRDVYTKSRKKPFGVGVQVGYGYPNGAYVGVGVSYNIINF